MLNLAVFAIWGMLAAQLVIQAALFLLLFVFALIGFVGAAERVPRSNNVAAMGASLAGAFAFAVLVIAGEWLARQYLTLSGTATSIFWACVAFSALYIAPQLPRKIRSGWRDAMYEDAFMRMAFEKAKNWPPKRPNAELAEGPNDE